MRSLRLVALWEHGIKARLDPQHVCRRVCFVSSGCALRSPGPSSTAVDSCGVLIHACRSFMQALQARWIRARSSSWSATVATLCGAVKGCFLVYKFAWLRVERSIRLQCMAARDTLARCAEKCMQNGTAHPFLVLLLICRLNPLSELAGQGPQCMIGAPRLDLRTPERAALGWTCFTARMTMLRTRGHHSAGPAPCLCAQCLSTDADVRRPAVRCTMRARPAMRSSCASFWSSGGLLRTASSSPRCLPAWSAREHAWHVPVGCGVRAHQRAAQ